MFGSPICAHRMFDAKPDKTHPRITKYFRCPLSEGIVLPGQITMPPDRFIAPFCTVFHGWDPLRRTLLKRGPGKRAPSYKALKASETAERIWAVGIFVLLVHQERRSTTCLSCFVACCTGNGGNPLLPDETTTPDWLDGLIALILEALDEMLTENSGCGSPPPPKRTVFRYQEGCSLPDPPMGKRIGLAPRELCALASIQDSVELRI